MYSFNERIRYSELGENGELSLVGLLNLFQDCSTFQSEDLGLGIKYLQGKKEAWWVNSWQIDISRLPGLAQKVEVGTFAYNFKSFYGYRNFFLKDEILKDKIIIKYFEESLEKKEMIDYI